MKIEWLIKRVRWGNWELISDSDFNDSLEGYDVTGERQCPSCFEFDKIEAGVCHTAVPHCGMTKATVDLLESYASTLINNKTRCPELLWNTWTGTSWRGCSVNKVASSCMIMLLFLLPYHCPLHYCICVKFIYFLGYWERYTSKSPDENKPWNLYLTILWKCQREDAGISF